MVRQSISVQARSQRANSRGVFLGLLCAASVGIAAPAAIGLPDEGMWLINQPPAAELEARYGFKADAAWLEHIQRSCVRFPGGSGSFVSPQGLVMTNHHVGAEWLHKLSEGGRDVIRDGYLARDAAEELRCPDLELRVLWKIEDVTAKVEGAAAGLATAEAGVARRKAMTQLEGEAKQSSGLEAEVVTLYQGGRYHLYSYKRYDDIRLVMAPEMGIAFFGGDADNFEFPRANLDVTFFRVYENGAPLSTPHYLKWSEKGLQPGDLVFVAGHPGSTQRLYTMAHLKYLRDHQLPARLQSLWRREVQLAAYSRKSAEHAKQAKDDYFGVQNSRKALTGQLSGMLDPQIWKAKQAAETSLREQIEAKPEWKAQWGDAWDQVAAAQATAKQMALRFSAVGGPGLRTGSELMTIAVHAVRMAEEDKKSNTDRLREYADAGREVLLSGIYSPAPVHVELEIDRLESYFLRMAENLGGEDPLVLAALDGRSPRARAEQLVGASKLLDVGARKALIEGGAAALQASNEPLFDLVRALDPESRQLRKRFEDEVQSVERAAYAKIAAARFAALGDSVYPDATFTLRLAFGTVKGYEQSGAAIEPFTDFEYLYARANERAGESDFALPERWVAHKGALDKSTPFNFVHTCDIIGGNSGSPTVDRKGEVVGLVFDGNIQSLVSGVTYTDKQGRAVSVDARGILEALEKVYEAQALVGELTGSAAAGGS